LVQTNASATLANYTNSTAGVRIWNVSVTATDNVDTVSKRWNWTVQSPIDITPPTTNISLSGTLGNNGWYKTNVLATLSARDDISGVNYTKYRINSGSWLTYTIPFTISIEGNNTVYYYSVDKVNNVEQTKSQIIKIDKTAPGSITNLKNAPPGRTYINWTWTDPAASDTSGFAYVMIYLSGAFKTNVSKGVKYYNATNLLPNTNYMLGTHTVDNAGNINSTWVNSSNIRTSR